MFHNMKVDIIYYNTNTDFELEFNLCGCCRMRLLTDKAEDQKKFVHCLARGVARSKVIIAIGSLFGESGIINIVARAISKGISVIDNKAYGIAGNDEIGIISGSTPLVTPEGYFGGCIIESGPQTLVMLTENKSIRKSIMTALIHPYIEELSAIELQQKAKATAPENSPCVPCAVGPDSQSDDNLCTIESADADQSEPEITDANPAVLEDTAEAEDTKHTDNTEKAAEPAAPAPDKPDNQAENPLGADAPVAVDKSFSEPFYDAENDVELYGKMSYITDSDEQNNNNAKLHNEAFGLFIEPERVKYTKKNNYEAAYRPSEKDLAFYSETGFKHKNTKKTNTYNFAILIFAILLLITLAVICFCLFYIPAKEGVSITEYINKTFGVLME